MTRQHQLILILILNVQSIFADTLCGDWTAYKDEKCVKAFDSIGLVSYDEAVAACLQQNSSHLVSIGSVEEQNFLYYLLFTIHKIVDNVWIGLKYQNSAYKWVDNTSFVYSNWAENNPTNRSDYCTQINADEEFHGKWSDVVCSKKNLVVCQKMPSISLIDLQNMLLIVRKDIESIVKNVVPVGFIYVQLTNQPEPKILWPNFEWEDISEEYDSLFFRVFGKNASSFGSIQEENSPRISRVEQSTPGCYDQIPLNYNLEIEDFYRDLCTSSSKGFDSTSSTGTLRFYTKGGEVRPRNSAVKVFKRVG